MASDEENWIPVPENPDGNIVITLPVTEERTGNGSSWAKIVEAERPGVSHSDPARAVYPSHLRSVVNSFDGTMPAERLGELPAGDQLRLFQLNGLPNRPCTARFSLPDNSVDARTILEQIMDTGVQRNHILCIQRLRTGMVEVTFAKKEDCDFFLSRAAIPSGQRPFTFSRSSTSSTLFVTVRDAPWELSDKLIADRLEQYGTVISIRRAYNQSLLPEKVHDGRRVLRMVLRRDIPSFIKFGPFLVRVFYPGQPKHCWKCSSPDHIGRECPSQFCFNCEKCGHIAPNCDERIKCSLCKSEEHLAVDCPGNWSRRTREQRTPRREESIDTVENAGEEAEDSASMDTENNEVEEVEELTDPGAASNDVDLEDSQAEESQSDDAGSEVSDSIGEFTSADAELTPQQRKRTAAKIPVVQKKSRTDENPP